MLTSKPPFQSSTTDEIYRRAKERDYEWPTPETSQKLVSRDAKDMVAMMLQEADMRPDPDLIVQHPFFTSGFVPGPADMVPRLRELPPEQDDFYATRMSASVQARAHHNFKEMCRECCVGPWSAVQLIHTQTWKEMAAEEKAGLTPMIPLADNLVYRPFDEHVREQLSLRAKHASSMACLASQPAPSSDGPPAPAATVQKAPAGLLRQPPQSFAAQQRAQNRPAPASASVPAPAPAPCRSRPPADGAPPASSTSTAARPRRDAAADGAELREAPGALVKSVRGSAPRTQLPTARSAPSPQVAERAATLSSEPRPSHRRQRSDSIRSASLFSAAERPHDIAGTEPDVILDRLKRLQAELERALNARTMAIISSKTVPPPHPHVVVKWVDYTNKFGLGYILNDGSVGCVLRDMPTTEGSKTAMLPPAGVCIRAAETHVLRREDESYPDRNQPVPMTRPIKFFENNGEGGLAEVTVSPEQFRVAVSEDGSAGKMAPGKDIYQHRKRERIILWKKFANYMVAYGRDEALAADEADATPVASPDDGDDAAALVTFYQRFGDVGCWSFCDGHVQVSRQEQTPRRTSADDGAAVQLSRPHQDCARRDGHLVSLLAPAAGGGRAAGQLGHHGRGGARRPRHAVVPAADAAQLSVQGARGHVAQAARD